jgi:hypothetical protein
VSASGKKIPVLVSPVGEIAGAAAVPVPLVILVMDVRVGIVPVVIVAAVDVVVPNVPVGITPVVIVPAVIVAAVDVVVPNVPVAIVPAVIVAAVDVVVPNVPVAIVPVVIAALVAFTFVYVLKVSASSNNSFTVTDLGASPAVRSESAISSLSKLPTEVIAV